MAEIKVWDFIDEFIAEFIVQLRSDDLRWGSTWLRRTRRGQEERTIKTFRDYFDQYEQAGVALPWLKIIGNALICWLRERHPEIWPE